MQDAIVLEATEFGACGTFSVYQYRQSNFNQLCLGANSQHQDATGLRVYAGAHVLIRFLTSPIGLELLDNASLVELGCGTGAVGSVAAVTANVKQLVVTDGDPRACELAKLNVNHLVHERKPLLPATAMQMYWGSGPVPQTFDVAIGCELMYYKTQLDALLSTVLALVGKSNGLFLHAHLFRKDEHDADMTAYFKKVGWDTLVVPVPTFVPFEEMTLWPNWLNTCCLVSGPAERIATLAQTHKSWSYFVDVATTLNENVKVAEEQENLLSTANESESDNDGFGSLFA